MMDDGDTHYTRDDLLTKDELIVKFGLYNYLVFVAMLAVSAGIGVFFWCRSRGHAEEFLLASKSMSTLPLAMSLLAAFMSAITLLGTPAEMYVSGTQYITLVLCYPLVMGSSAHLYLPVFQSLEITTSYEYLGLRYLDASMELRFTSFYVIKLQPCTAVSSSI